MLDALLSEWQRDIALSSLTGTTPAEPAPAPVPTPVLDTDAARTALEAVLW